MESRGKKESFDLAVFQIEKTKEKKTVCFCRMTMEI